MITGLDKDTALVLIDFQKSNVKDDKVHPVRNVLEKVALLVTVFHSKGLPVVVVNVDPMGAAWTKARVEQKMVPQSSVVQSVAEAVMPLAQSIDIVPELGTRAADVHITKHAWNAFFQTSLHAELQQRQITQIVLAGISTSIGVEGTARAASELGYNIAFATDAMTDRVLAAHNNSLQYIFPRIGELGTTQEIIDKIPEA